MSTPSNLLGLDLPLTDADLSISAEEEQRRRERQEEKRQEIFRQNRLARLQEDQSREDEVQKIQEVRQTSPGVPTPPTPEVRPPNPALEGEFATSRVVEFMERDADKYGEGLVDLQRQFVTRATSFRDEEGIKIDFPKGVNSYENKVRLMLMRRGVAVPVTTEDGQEVKRFDAPTGKTRTDHFNLIPTYRYKDMVSEGRGGPLPNLVTGAVQAVVPGKVGGYSTVGREKLRRSDEILKNVLGIDQNARTFYLEAKQRGDLREAGIASTTTDLGGMIVEGASRIPSLLGSGSDAVMEGMVSLIGPELVDLFDYPLRKSGAIPEDATPFSEVFNRLFDGMGEDFIVDVHSVAEKISMQTGIKKDIVEVMMNPEGFMDRVFEILGVDAPIYAAIFKGMFRGTQKRFGDMENFATELYGGVNFAEAMARAQRRGIDYNQFKRMYTEKRLAGNLSEKVSNQMDEAMALAISTATPTERRAILKDQLTDYRKRIDQQIELARNKYNISGDTKAYQRAKKKIATLQQERRDLVYGSMIPRRMASLGGELKWTTAGIAGTTEVVSQLVTGFGAEGRELRPDEEYLVEMISALAVATTYGRNIPSKAIRGLRNTGGLLKDLSARGVNIATLQKFGITKEQYATLRADKTLRRDAMKAIDQLYKQPKEFQMLWFAGADEAVNIQADLLSIADRVGVKLEGNEFVDSIATLGDLGGLVALSRSLDEKLTLTSLDKVGPLILQKEKVVAQEQELLGKLGKVMTTFEQMAMAGAERGMKEAEGGVTQFNQMLRRYIAKRNEQFRQTKKTLRSYMRAQNEYFEMLAKSDLSNDATGGFDSVVSLANKFDLENDLAVKGIGAEDIDADVLDLAPAQQLDILRKDLEKSRQQARELIELNGASLTPQLASTGYGSVHAAHSFVLTLKAGKSRYDELYANFDKNAAGAQADVSDVFLEIQQNPQAFVDYNPEELAQGLVSLEKGSIFPTTQRNMFVLFNEGAERSLEYIRGIIGDNAYQKFMNDVQDKEPLSQWVMLRNYLLDGAGNSAIDPAVARQVAENMPLLINPQEWRVINKHIGRMIGVAERKPEIGQQYYYNLKKEWNKVGDPNSTRHWATGWKEGQAKDNIAEEINAKFRTAQDYYETEVFERVQNDPLTRGWESVLTKAKIEAAASDDPLAVAKNIGVRNPKQQPVLWLDEALKPGVDRLKTMPMPLSDDFGELQALIGDRIGRMGGIKDPESGQFRIVVKSADDADATMVTAGQQLRKSIELWLQSKALQTKSGLAMQGDKAVTVGYSLDKTELMKLVTSMANIKVYEKTADGRFIEYVDDVRQSASLIDEDEVFRVLTSDDKLNDLTGGMKEALERAKVERKRIFAEWDEGLKDLNDVVNDEIRDIDTIMQSMNLGSQRLSVGDLDKAAEGVYNAVVKGDSLNDEIPRLKQAVSKMYKDPKEGARKADETVRFLVLRHLRKASQAPAKTTTPVVVDKGGIMHIQTAGIDAQQLSVALGSNDPRVESRLRKILGEQTYEDYRTINRTVERMQGKYVRGADGRLPTMSLESVLSRIYNINREVVSPTWVITETIIRAARTHEGALLRSMLNNPELAKAVMEIIDTGEVPRYAVDPQLWRPLYVEILRQEALNENMPPSARFQSAGEALGIGEQAEADRQDLSRSIEQTQGFTIVPNTTTPMYSQGRATRTYTPASDQMETVEAPVDLEKTFLERMGFRYD